MLLSISGKKSGKAETKKPAAAKARKAGVNVKVNDPPASMLADGLCSVHFQTPVGEGDGVVVIIGDKLRGGDAAFAYFGTIHRTDNGFSAKLVTKRYAAGRASVFNMGPSTSI